MTGFTTDLVKVKAKSNAGILPTGVADQSISMSFKGTAGDLGDAQLTMQIMATITARLKEVNDQNPPPYMAELSATFGDKFSQNATSSGNFTSTQIPYIDATAKAGINAGGLAATVRANVQAAFDSLSSSDVVSVKRSAGVQISYTDKLFNFANWNISGDVSATWDNLSTNTPNVTATGTATLKNVNTHNKLLDTVLSGLYMQISSTAPGDPSLGYALQHNIEMEFGIRWKVLDF